MFALFHLLRNGLLRGSTGGMLHHITGSCYWPA
jgi:hypothetical protein